MSVRVRKSGLMVDTLGKLSSIPTSYLKLWNYIYRPPRRQREATGGHAPWRQREATVASSRAQILAQDREPSPVTTPPGHLKLHLFREIN